MRSVYAETVIESNPGQIIPAFLEQPHLQEWWGVYRSLIEPLHGGLWTLSWKNNNHGLDFVSSGIIEEIIPHEKLKIAHMVYLHPERQILGPMELEIRVSQTDEKHAKVHVTQSGYQNGGDWDWYYEAVVQGWPAALNLLKEYLERKEEE